ncbi:transcriptional regulator with XRE-family HTH domain [Mucilaginibacter sp. OAE612]|uniref:helix-turn-helix domain-containing protein n=1 Tax=unclassified Mucilaginibacter TaxID=2617802 RepID=UPI00359E05D5
MEHSDQTKHLGYKISMIRSLRGIKQEALALEVGISQQEVSQIEQTGHVDAEILNKIAIALRVSPDAIESFDDNLAIYTINNNVENNTFADSSIAIQQEFNPIEKIIELYERLLASEKEKAKLIETKL